MTAAQLINPFTDAGTVAGDIPRAPTTFHVPLNPELARLVELYAEIQNISPETAIAEAIRAFLGADQ